jgi:hypothetical protein
MELRTLSDNLEKLQTHLDTRLDKIENKLDNHLERISKAEADIGWLRGHSKMVMTILLTALSGLAMAVYQLMTGKS